MHKNDWKLVLPIILLFSIGFAGFVMPAWFTGMSIAAKQYAPRELSGEWLGFFGSILGATMALVAALIAVIPVRRQLAELAKQNDYISLERLGNRADRINADLVLLYAAASNVEVMNRMIDVYIHAGNVRQHQPIEDASGRLQESVTKLQVARGSIWGTKKQQMQKDVFIDTCLNASSAAMQFDMKVKGVSHIAHIVAKDELAKWRDLHCKVKLVADPLHSSIRAELARTADEISAIENRILAGR